MYLYRGMGNSSTGVVEFTDNILPTLFKSTAGGKSIIFQQKMRGFAADLPSTFFTGNAETLLALLVIG